VSFLESVATAVPGEPIPQADVKERANMLLEDVAPDLLQYLNVFDTTGIQKRHFVRALDWYLETHGWKERSDVYRAEGLALLESCAKDALNAADLKPKQVDGIVFVSTTGISTPSLDARLMNKMGFRPDILRVPVWGLGCAGGVAGLSLANDLATAHPDRRYLVLSLELCSLAFNLSAFDTKSFIASTLFSDGAAAAIVRGDQLKGRDLGHLRDGYRHEWSDSEDVMGWDVMDEGLSVVFSREIPKIVERDLAPVVQTYLAREGQAPVSRYVFHPGGAKVLQAYENALGINGASLDASKKVLREYGNMSSPTVLFVLAESLKKKLRSDESALLAAVGPGFAGELSMLQG
jgi:alkylresorcinol/alkylpyrone synthase